MNTLFRNTPELVRQGHKSTFKVGLKGVKETYYTSKRGLLKRTYRNSYANKDTNRRLKSASKASSHREPSLCSCLMQIAVCSPVRFRV